MRREMAEPLLKVNDLCVEIATRSGKLVALNNISLEVARGEILGMVGESGAGKSMFGAAVTGLLPRNARVSHGSILFEGQALTALDDKALNRVRGHKIGTIFQDPLTSLDPLMTIGDQLTETILTHAPDLSREAAYQKAVALLQETGIPDPAKRMRHYPHQFSGGMRQRVVIALALSSDPALIIADEPTTALDVSIQAQIISLLKRLARERGTAVLLITHDMGVIAQTCDNVAVLYAGHLVEIGTVANVIGRPQHPYTKGLMGSIPNVTSNSVWLEQIEGMMPTLDAIPEGCPFHTRCRACHDRCVQEKPPLMPMGSCHAACWLASPTGRAVPDSLVKFHPRRGKGTY